jgi:hypothetical protein
VPTQSTTFKDLLGGLWMQGIPNSDAPTVESSSANLRKWIEKDASFKVIDGMNKTMQAGKGYILYVYKDDNLRKPGVQGGFPKIVHTNKTENGNVNVSVSATDANNDNSIDEYEGWNLLGNPYGTDISVDAVIQALQNVNSNVNANVYIWNAKAGNGNGGYETLGTGNGKTIAPFQAFFIRYTSAGVTGNASFTRSKLAANHGAQFYGRAIGMQRKYGFKLYLGNGKKFDTYRVQFRKKGSIGEDRLDAYKLFSLNPHSISLYSTVGKSVRLAKNVLPLISSLKGKIYISLHFDVPKSGAYTFRWSDVGSSMPQQVKIYLLDNKTGNKLNLRTSQKYAFNFSGQINPTGIKSDTLSPALTGAPNALKNGARFELLVVPSAASKDQNPRSKVQKTKLWPNYPNPFTNQTTIKLQLKKKCHVNVTIYNIIGQKIATLMNATMQKGPHEMHFQAPADMVSGVYICRVVAGDKVLTTKMTCIK